MARIAKKLRQGKSEQVDFDGKACRIAPDARKAGCPPAILSEE